MDSCTVIQQTSKHFMYFCQMPRVEGIPVQKVFFKSRGDRKKFKLSLSVFLHLLMLERVGVEVCLTLRLV